MNNPRQQALQAAKMQIARDLAHYEYPSQKEIDIAWLKLQALKLEMVHDVLEKVANSATQKKSCGCGCSGKSGSAGRETKSMSNGSRSKPQFFAQEMQRQQDESYERFCAKFPDMCKG